MVNLHCTIQCVLYIHICSGVWILDRIYIDLSSDSTTYNISTNSAVFCALRWMYLPPPFPSMQLK